MPATPATFASRYLAEHPVPPGIVGALRLHGYQLLADVAGIGAGRLGSTAFLVVAPDPDPALPDASTHVSLLQSRLREEAEAAAFVGLAAQLGLLRLSGYRLSLERNGLLSAVSLVDPASGALVLSIPPKHPGRLLGGGASVSRLLAAARALPPAAPPPDLDRPELVEQALLALALGDSELSGAEAVEVADRAFALLRAGRAPDAPAALAAAKDAQAEG